MKYTVPIKLRRKTTFTIPPYDDPLCFLEAAPALLAGVAEGLTVDELLESFPDFEPCWSWSGSANNAGYGQIKFNGRNWNTHKLSYHILVEPLPLPGKAQKAAREEGADLLIVDHLCHNRLCLNPAHLELITQSENVKRGGRHA